MLWPQLHQYQTSNTHDSSAEPAGTTSIEMRLAWIYIISTLVIIASCEKEESKSYTSKNEEKKPKEDNSQPETLENIDTLLHTVAEPESELPILPPIILLDFTNDTNSTSDEKSKRTVNGNLGYGYDRNNLFSGKYNYYFPAGKTGTTVSIEESITPFQPKTILESLKPVNEKIYDNGANNDYIGSLRYTGYSTTPAPILQQQFLQRQQQQLRQQQLQQLQLQQQQFISKLQYPNAQPIYGQRTKLQKAPAENHGSAQSFSTTRNPFYDSYSTPRPGFDSYTTTRPSFSAYTTPKPSYTAYTTTQPSFHANTYTSGLNLAGYTTPRPPSRGGFSSPSVPTYVNPTIAPYDTSGYNVQGQGFFTSRPSYESVAPLKPSYESVSNRRPIEPNSAYPAGLSLATALSGYPKYTIENGVKYEHKIIWKYPDGKVSETAPASFSNTHSPFAVADKPSLNVAYENTNPISGYQNIQDTTYTGDSVGNIYSQSPAQFPVDQNSNYPKQSQFVSSTNFGNAGQQQAYRLSYQNQLPQASGQDGSSKNVFSSSSEGRTSTFDKTKQAFEPEYKKNNLFTSYSVNSPNPEYTYTTKNPLRTVGTTKSSNLYTPSGEISPSILSKYTPQVQRYLMKALKNGISSQNNSYGNSNSQTYSNLDYSNLLRYNPSISQYIRDPSSILNAQPTFIQAGNSLIPVIILRVDGAAPIEPKTTPNINLKALLRQYLTQYANSINDLNQNGNYGHKAQSYEKSEAVGQNPLYDLTQLTESLSQYSHDPTFARTFSQKFAKNIAENPQNFNTHTYSASSNYNSPTELESDKNTNFAGKYGSQISKPQKVKSVQIIEDPRFTSYKTNS